MNKERIIKKPKVIIYDEENFNYVVGSMGSMSSEPIVERYYVENRIESLPRPVALNFVVDEAEELSNIELDPTTMKRIALYNKEQEIKRLDEQIKSKKDEIKELEDILNDREKRVKKLKDFITTIFEIDVDDDEIDYYD